MELPARIGKYELLEFLGGGMSEVYRVRDTVIGRTVALKILTEQGCLDQETKQRFLAEAQMSGNIAHDNIIHVYDYGEDHGRPYIVMEFLTGQNLHDAIKKGETGDLESKLRIALQIARALEYVHSKNIVHRDIKPDNIHLDAAGKPKLMDFGIAKADGLSLTRAGFALGTPYYMAPEQVLGERVTEQADVYSYGILLYELLSGTRPLTGDTVERLFYAILNEPLNIAPLRQAGIPAPICDLIVRCTAKKTAERIPNMTAVCAELEAFMSRTQAATMNLSTAGMAAETPVRRKSGKLIVAVIGVLVVLIASALIWYARPKSGPVLKQVLETDTGTMMLVPAGRALFGKDKESVIVPAFYVDRTEVTNAAYGRFCSATGRPLPLGFPADKPQYPVVNVTIADAKAYARWARKRLPNAQEWEKAARGTDGLLYPWGNNADAKKANVLDNPSMTTPMLMPADSFQEGASPFGAVNMSGNVFEIVDEPITPGRDIIEGFAKALNPPPAANELWYMLRGGSYLVKMEQSVADDYTPLPARLFNKDIGFRCVRSVPQ